MTLTEMITVLQAAQNGEPIECSPKNRDDWLRVSNPQWDFERCDYRIALKKSLVEELREYQGKAFSDIRNRAADRIEELEGELLIDRSPKAWTTYDLLEELKRRTK